MTLTVRSATVTGATTKGSPLTHAELDENFNHLSQAANITVTQSGSGAGSSRSVQAEIRDLCVNVKSGPFGATGDGTTDDRTALFNANAVSQEKFVPAGTYLVNSALTLSGVWRFADGAQIKPASGIAVTLDSSFVGFSGDVHPFDTSVGTLTANAGSFLSAICVSDSGQTKNILNGYAGNTIDAAAGACLIAGGGNSAGNENSIGDTDYSTISGGYDNVIGDCIASTISGGAHHTISGTATHATIGGGTTHTISAGTSGTIGGGSTNTVSAQEGTVCGGVNNTASGQAAAVVGGSTNTASAQNAFVGAGTGVSCDGTNSVVVGGNNNDLGANADTAVIVGGQNNNCSPGTAGWGNHTFIGGGSGNVIGGATTSTCAYAVIAGGNNNTLNFAQGGCITGGENNQVNAEAARAGGFYAVANFRGGDVWACGRFAAAGDAQFQSYIARISTTDGTANVNLRTGTAANAVVSVPLDSTWGFTAHVVARRTDQNGESAYYKLEGCIDNNAGTVALVGTVTQTVIAEDTAGWDATAVASSGRLEIQVTGEADKTIYWVARVDLVQVTG